MLEDAFKAFINEYTVDSKHLTYLKSALIEQFGKATKNVEKDAKKFREQIIDLKEKQSALVDKNIEGVISDRILQQQLELIEEKLLITNEALLKLPDKVENIDRLFTFSCKYLIDPAAVWSDSSFSTKVNLQWCEFPQGLMFDGKKFRTQYIASIFKAKSNILPALSHKVDFTDKKTNNSKPPNSELLHKMYAELKQLAAIMEEKDKEEPP